MAENACLNDEELLAASTDPEPSPRARGHLATCATCRRQVERHRAEQADLRSVWRSSFSPLPADGAATIAPLTSDVLAPSGVPAACDESPLPSTIGQYRIDSRLGKAGQAEVFLARHPHLGHAVAIKLGYDALDGASAEARGRLEKEGRLLARLKDQDFPHLLPVHDFGFHEGRPYLVMKYIDGRTLDQAAADKRSPRETARLVSKVARGLAGPHQLGVTHRDLKPGNILLDKHGAPWVIDFGLALQRDAWAQDHESDGAVSGTIQYMAPEQARGEVEALGPACDIFALGGVLYFLLTGKHPFPGRTCEEALDRARRCDFDRDALKAVPPRLRDICLKAMAAEPAGRHPSAAELADALERFARPSRGLLYALAAAAALLAVGLANWLWPRPDAGKQDTPTPRSEPGPAFPAAQFLLEVDSRRLSVTDRPIPLRPGRKLKFRCDIPRGFHAALFWVDTRGVLKELQAETSSAQPFDELMYPRPGDVLPLKAGDPSGTVLALVCASPRSKPSVEDVEKCLLEAVRLAKRDSLRLPETSVDAFFWLGRDEVKAFITRGLPQPEQNAAAEVQDRLIKLRPLLRERFEFLAGVAVVYKDERLDGKDR